MKRWLVLFFFLSFPAIAFEVRNIGTDTAPAYRRWNIANGPVHVSLNQLGSGDESLESTETALLQALATWQNVPYQGLRFQYDGTSSQAVVNSADLQNSVVWIEQDWQYPENVAAVTVYSYYLDDPSTPVDTDILLNGRDFSWKTATDEPGLDIRRGLTHELGHLLGLSHSSVQNASLFPYVRPEIKSFLSLDDRAGIRFLYGSPIQNFQQISPIRKANYSRGMAQQNLPLPVFRWGTGGNTQFSLEFSSTLQFTKILRFPATPGGFHPLTAAEQLKLEAASDHGRIFWRVRSGANVTTPRALFFR